MRLQLDLTDARVAQLDRIMEEADLSTRKELFNNALSMFEWAVKEVKRGNVIASINEKDGKYRELHMPSLSSVAAAAVDVTHEDAIDGSLARAQGD